MRRLSIVALIGSALLGSVDAEASVIDNTGVVFNLNAVSDIYSVVYGGPSLGANGGAFFVDKSPVSFQVSKQGPALAPGDTITAGAQSLPLQGGLSLDLNALSLTLTNDSATLQGTTLRDAAGLSLDGATVHGLKGLMAYTLRDAANKPIYEGKFVFREEDSNLTMGIVAEVGGVLSVFLCGASGAPFIGLPNAGEAVLTVLDPTSPIEQAIQAAVNGLEIELAFGTTTAIAEPGGVPLLAASSVALSLLYRRRQAGRAS